MSYPFQHELNAEEEIPYEGSVMDEVIEEQARIKEDIKNHAIKCGNEMYETILPVLGYNSVQDIVVGILARGWREDPKLVHRDIRSVPIYKAVISVYLDTNGYYLCPEELFDFVVSFVFTWGDSPVEPDESNIFTIGRVYYDRYLAQDLGASPTGGIARTRSPSPDTNNKRVPLLK